MTGVQTCLLQCRSPALAISPQGVFFPFLLCVMVPTLRTIMNSSYYYEYLENIHLSVKLTPA